MTYQTEAQTKKDLGSRTPAGSIEVNDFRAITDQPVPGVTSSYEKHNGKVCDHQVPSFNTSENVNYPHWTGEGAL
jgi:hypothetical protein